MAKKGKAKGKGKSSAPRRKKKGGVMMGMRGGFQKAVKGVGDPQSKTARAVWNVLTILAVLLAATLVLSRCGVIQL